MRNKNFIYLTFDILLFFIFTVIIDIIFSIKYSFSWFFFFVVLFFFLIIFFVFIFFKKNIYNYFPEQIVVFKPSLKFNLKLKYYLFNSHFLLLITICNLLNCYDNITIGITDKYPIVSGNIIIFFKHQSSVIGLSRDSNADYEVYRVGMHITEIVKQQIRDIALNKTKESIKRENERYIKDLIKSAKSFNIKQFRDKIKRRVKYRGKEPIALLNIDLYKYSASRMSSRQTEVGMTDLTHRNPPRIIGPIELRKGLNDEKSLLSIPHYPVGGILPDSINFLHYFEKRKYFIKYYSVDFEDAKIRNERIVEPNSPPILIWYNNDCKEPFEIENQKNKNREIKDQFFNRFFGKKILIYLQGYNFYSDPTDGTTAYRSLEADRYFDHMIKLPPIHWKKRYGNSNSRKIYNKELVTAIQKLHEELPPLLKNNLEEGIEIEEYEKTLYTFNYDFVFFGILFPLLLWMIIKIIRFNFFTITRYKKR